MDYISYVRGMVGQEKLIMVVAAVLLFDEKNRVLLQQRADSKTWGIPGGYMEMGETVSETANREIFEETGLSLGKLQLMGIYSGKKKERTLANGDQVALVQLVFTCNDYEGELNGVNEETLDLRFFDCHQLPEELFSDHGSIIKDYVTKELPVIN